MRIKYLIHITLVLLLFACTTGNKSDNPVIHIGKTSIEIELANTPEKRQLGLMNRTSLDADNGMLFVFEKEQFVYFWMKNTSIPLSIAYIDRSGRITEILNLEPYSLKMVRSSYPVVYALEVNRGFFKKNGIKVGDVIKFP